MDKSDRKLITRASKRTEDLLRLVDERRATTSQVIAFSVDDVSSMNMLDDLGETFEVVQARFTGSLAATHSIGVREATVILGSLQEVISEVGAAIREVSPKRGPLPTAILKETELQLSPQVAPGSVIFSMSPAREDSLFDSSTLLNDALREVFSLFEQVELPVSSGGTPDTISDALRRFGPRTARHLVRFAGSLKEHSLNLDIGVARTGSSPEGSRISSAGADFLRSLAKKATKRESSITVTGDVWNLGKDHSHKILTTDRGKITVRGTAEITDVLHAAFRSRRVQLDVVQTESINLGTGAVSFSYSAVGATILDEPSSSQNSV